MRVITHCARFSVAELSVQKLRVWLLNADLMLNQTFLFKEQNL